MFGFRCFYCILLNKEKDLRHKCRIICMNLSVRQWVFFELPLNKLYFLRNGICAALKCIVALDNVPIADFVRLWRLRAIAGQGVHLILVQANNVCVFYLLVIVDDTIGGLRVATSLIYSTAATCATDDAVAYHATLSQHYVSSFSECTESSPTLTLIVHLYRSLYWIKLIFMFTASLAQVLIVPVPETQFFYSFLLFR